MEGGVTKTCAVSGQKFVITDDDLKFYQKMGVPAPTLCPTERQRRRLAWRNERSLYQRKCDGTGENIISIHAPGNSFPIFKGEYFYTDNWDGLDYGQEFDFGRPFFEQFAELYSRVPQMATCTSANENSEYGNLASWNKDCYMCIESDNNRSCFHCGYSFRNTDCIDCTHIKESQLCRYCVDCQKCYDLAYSRNCQNCSESYFLKNCIGCKNCFGCVNLRQKQYCWMNEQLTKEAYEAKLAQINLGGYESIKKLQQDFEAFAKQFPVKYYQGLQNENVSGDYLDNCKDIQDCYDASELRDCKYCCNFERSKDCYDIDGYGGLEGVQLSYENHTVGRGSFNVMFCNMVFQQARDVFYSDDCIFSSDLFGCISLKKNKYCILNKQYSEKEYFVLRDKIIAHMKETKEWGEFFPVSLSPFAYNETVAQEYYPLTKQEALARGYKWRDEAEKSQHSEFDWNTIADDINDIPDTITSEVLHCQRSNRGYKIQTAELKAYRKMNIPIPRLHPNERHKDRMALRNPRKLYKHQCAVSGKEILTTYAPDRPEKVLCEEEYLKVLD